MILRNGQNQENMDVSEIFISWKGEMTLWVVQKILMNECVEK